MPLDVRLGGDDPAVLRELDGDAFWSLVRATHEAPTTAAPSPEAFAAAFETLAARGCDAVVCVTISADLSATTQSAALAATRAPVPVHVVDSRNATMGEGLLVLEALEVRALGHDIDGIARHLLECRTRLRTYGTLDTLEYLRRGGRIGSAQAFFGALLAIKPVVTVTDGRVEGESRQRTRHRALRYLAALVARAAPVERIAVVHAGAPDVDTMVALLDGIESRAPLVVSSMGPVIGAHTGPGTIGVTYLERPSDTRDR